MILFQNILSGDTTIRAKDLISGVPSTNGLIQIDSEIIRYGSASDFSFLNCVRGVGGTTAASHTSGATISYVSVTNVPSGVVELSGSGAPTNGQTGNGTAPVGSRYTDTASGNLYVNTGSLNNPTWTLEGAGGSSVALAGSANTITISGSSTGNPVTITATGSDTDVPIQITAKGSNGPVIIGPSTNLAAIESFHTANTPLDVVIQPRTTNVYTGITVTSANDTNNYYGYTEYLRSRGTTASPLPVQSSDILGEMAGIGYSNTGYKVFSLLDAVATSTSDGSYQMKFLTGGSLPGSAQLYFNATGFGVNTLPTKYLDISANDSGATSSARVRNTASNGASSWLAANDSNHTFEIGVGGTARGDGLQDAGYFYTTLPVRFCAPSVKFTTSGISDSGNKLQIHDSTGPTAVEVTSTTQGFLPPKMTTTQRNAISSPVEGLMIWNTDTHTINCYDGTSWKAATLS